MKYLTYLFEHSDILAGRRISSNEYGRLLGYMQRLMSLGQRIISSGCASQSEIVLVHCALDHDREHGENITVAQAAKKLGVPMPSISRSLRSLTEKGFVERYNDPADRRAVRVRVTKRGENELKRVLENIFSVFDKAMCDFSDEEIIKMIDLHGRFIDSISKAINEGRTTDNAGNQEYHEGL
ncbi:MAG: MarR family transcriptional regulator [Oscillospiraceae bacterium]|nr:MarR family transcriptional regulator [Oscillospiraceae bacterium]